MIPVFRSSGTPTLDYAPIVGTDAEYMRFLELRRAPRKCPATCAQTPKPAVVEADTGRECKP